MRDVIVAVGGVRIPSLNIDGVVVVDSAGGEYRSGMRPRWEGKSDQHANTGSKAVCNPPTHMHIGN